MTKLPDYLSEFAKTLPKFEDGRIDYSTSKKAAVVTCFIEFNNKVLLLKRSDKVSTYQGLWNTVAGYWDELIPLKLKVEKELSEEVGIKQKDIQKFKFAKPFEFFDETVNRIWIIHPVMIILKNKVNIKIDWEHTEYKWIDPDNITKYDVVPKLDRNLKMVMNFGNI